MLSCSSSWVGAFGLWAAVSHIVRLVIVFWMPKFDHALSMSFLTNIVGYFTTLE